MKPVSINMAWTEASAFIRREASLLVPVMLLLVAVPLAAIFLSIPPELRNYVAGPGVSPPQIPALSMVVIILSSLIMLGGTLVCYALALMPGVSVREAIAIGYRRMPVALGAALLAGLAIALPAALLTILNPVVGKVMILVGSLIFSVRLLFLNAHVVASRDGVLQSLKASWAMASGQMVRLFAFIVAITALIMLAQVVAELLLGLLGLAIGGKDVGRQAGDIGAALALALGQMVLIVMTSRLYRQAAPAA